MLHLKSLEAPSEGSSEVQPVTKLGLADKKSSLIPMSNKLCELGKIT